MVISLSERLMFTLGTRAEYLGRDKVWVKRTAHFEVIVYIPLYEQRRQEVDVAVALTVGLCW